LLGYWVSWIVKWVREAVAVLGAAGRSGGIGTASVVEEFACLANLNYERRGYSRR